MREVTLRIPAEVDEWFARKAPAAAAAEVLNARELLLVDVQGTGDSTVVLTVVLYGNRELEETRG